MSQHRPPHWTVLREGGHILFPHSVCPDSITLDHSPLFSCGASSGCPRSRLGHIRVTAELKHAHPPYPDGRCVGRSGGMCELVLAKIKLSGVSQVKYEKLR